jgi:hypothetical protein
MNKLEKRNLLLAAALLFLGGGAARAQTAIGASFIGEVGSVNMSAGSIQMRSSGPQTGAAVLSAGAETINTGFWFTELSFEETAVSPALVAVSSSVGTSGGSLTYTTPSGAQVNLSIPPGAFSSNETVTLSTVNFESLLSGSGNLTGLDVGFAVTLSGAEPSTPVTLTITIPDSSIVGVPDSELALATYVEGPPALWDPLTTTVTPNTAADSVTLSATVPHLSVFQVMRGIPSTTVKTAVAYPNPWRFSQASFMTFKNLPANARLRIYTLSGLLVKDLTTNGTGETEWDGTNQSGRQVASGFYFVFAQGNGTENTIKIAVQR